MEELPDVFNDFDLDFSAYPEASKAYLNDRRNRRKIQEMTQKLNPTVMHPLRVGKKLLVLDIDYSESHLPFYCDILPSIPLCRCHLNLAILDTKPLLSGALPPTECARPRLHEFLEAIYPHYDICIWYDQYSTELLCITFARPTGRRQVGSGLKRNLWSWE